MIRVNYVMRRRRDVPAETFAELVECERTFVDLSRSTTWLAKEQVLVER